MSIPEVPEHIISYFSTNFYMFYTLFRYHLQSNLATKSGEKVESQEGSRKTTLYLE